ncbi:hypothetical protein HYDPIDRAFT_165806 [Hydnomerulius pinastri MD-312]|nr:hypothetical protein HYDPIDRAFT_165806 [Hydnomerulius pinastri MD-312]
MFRTFGIRQVARSFSTPISSAAHLRTITHHYPAQTPSSDWHFSYSAVRMQSFSNAANLGEDSVRLRGPGTFDDVIARSKGSSEIQSYLVNLPEIPKIPGRKSVLHINHGDLEPHLQPLLSCHWHVDRIRKDVQDLEVLSINKLFSFKNFKTAVEFFEVIAGYQAEENHHARVIFDYSNVYVSVHTHVAFQPILSATGESETVKVAGLTMRDVRFAARTEKLHQAFLEDGRATTKVPAEPARLQEWSMECLRQRYPVSNTQDIEGTGSS